MTWPGDHAVTGLINELATKGPRPAIDWCQQQGYNPWQILWLIHAHRSAQFGHSYFVRCPCPEHGGPLLSPDELDRHFDRPPRRIIPRNRDPR
jgi:hypothetical protein